MAKSRIKAILILLVNIILYFIYGNYIWFILLTGTVTFFLSKIIKKEKNYFLMLFTYLLILMPFLFFKYIVVIIKINILVPLGISYYTLALISYVSDIYHDRYQPEEDLINFMLYVLYFPCLFIGPINKYNEFSEQIKKIKFVKENVANSLLKISVGAIKKIIIANKLNVVIAILASNTTYTGLYVLLGCFIYSILLYCDFSGGVDIVLGISKIFNIDLVPNFDKPYLSQTIKEFWRRWHMSLGRWLKDYIYIPLGGNREGNLNTKINTLVTFIISGLWHGINYILWGILNGIFVIINLKFKNKYLNILLTMIIISLLWVFFIYGDMLVSLKMLLSIFNITSFSLWNLGLNIYDYIIILSFLVMVIMYEIKIDKVLLWFDKISFNKKVMIFALILLLILVFGNYGLDVNSQSFIYGSF